MHDLYTAKLLNGELEQIACRLWDEDRILPIERYRRAIDRIVDGSPFTMVFQTVMAGRSEGSLGADQVKALKEAADYAHSRGLKLGIEVITEGVRATRLQDMLGVAVHSVSEVTPDDVKQGRKRILVEIESEISCIKAAESKGSSLSEAEPEISPISGRRLVRAQQSQLLKAYVYKRADWRSMHRGTLQDVTNSALCISGRAVETTVDVPIGPDAAGCVLHVITVHYYDHPNCWSRLALDAARRVLEACTPAKLDGAILDNVGGVWPCLTSVVRGRHGWHEQWFCEDMRSQYLEVTGRNLEEDLLYMKIVPVGEDGRRTRALADYFDLHRSQVVELEQAFYKMVKDICGPNALVGTHSVRHSGAPEDMWRNGLSLWDAKRDFGQVDGALTDGGLLPAIGLALSRKWGARVWYDVSCGRDVSSECHHAIDAASMGGRIYYHALGNLGRYGCAMDHGESMGHNESTDHDESIDDTASLDRLSTIEGNIRLLNWFQTELPESDILVVMGYPEMVTADSPDTVLCMNSRYGAGYELAQLLFQMGFRCDLIPSYEIGDNDLRICCSGGMHYGQTGSYRLVIYVLPEYSRPETLDFLCRYLEAGGRLVLIGDCTRDVDGNDVSGLFAGLRQRSLATFAQTTFADSDQTLLRELLTQLGFLRNDIPCGSRFSDRQVVVLQDHHESESARGKGAEAVPGSGTSCDREMVSEFTIGDRTVSARFHGLLAIRLTDEGRLEKLAASRLAFLSLDGEVLFCFGTPRDVLAQKVDSDGEQLLVVCPSESMSPRVVAFPISDV